MDRLLYASVLANLILVFILLVLWLHAQRRATSEKLATFAGCIGALVDGLGLEQPEDRLRRVSLGLSNMRSGMNADEIRQALGRASVIRLFRAGTPLMDVGGEHTRFLCVESASGNSASENVWQFIESASADNHGAEAKPRNQFGDEILAQAQLELECQLLSIYRRSLRR